MGIRKKPHAARTSDTVPSAKPACIQRAETIRRKAQHYTNITEQTGTQCNDRHGANQQRELAEREMAALRAEAVQARRLASHIENLHQPANRQRKGRIMSSSISDPGQAQRTARRETDMPHSTGSQLSFNPLHPSMELPPEHLIRLLGLENKPKRRKKRPTSRSMSSPGQKSAGPTKADKPVKLSLPSTPPASAEREKDMAPAPFEEPRRNLVVASLAAGVIAGIALSIYLFRGGPEEVTATIPEKTPVHNTEKTPPKTAATERVTEPVMTPPATAPVAAPPEKTSTVAATPALAETTPDAMESSVQGPVIREDALLPQADIETEHARLRDEAERRFAERMLQEEVRQDRSDLTSGTAPTNEPPPAPASEPEPPAEPAEPFVMDTAPASMPEPPIAVPAAAATEAGPEPEFSGVAEVSPVNPVQEQDTDNAAVHEPAYPQPAAPTVEDEATPVENETPGEALF